MRARMLALTATLALTLPLGISAPAEAATLRDWERLAGCESGQRWHINTGNGYYGGLQFSAGTWRSFGGRKFAPQAHKATKLEQITIAKRVKRTQGWGAWPSCSARLGYR